MTLWKAMTWILNHGWTKHPGNGGVWRRHHNIHVQILACTSVTNGKKCRRILCLGKYFRATEAFVVNFPRTCHKQEGQKLVVATARDAKIVFERRHEVVALHEQLGRGDVEKP